MTLNDVYRTTGISRAQISRIENGKADPRVSTITQLLTCYGASLGDVDTESTQTMSLEDVSKRAERGRRALAAAGLTRSDPTERLSRKQQLGFDVSAETKANASRS